MNRLLLLISIFILWSCTRDNSSLNTTEDPEISFDIDGGHYSFKGNQTRLNGGVGIFALKIKNPAAFYSLAGNSGPDNQIQLLIVADSLMSTSYHQESGAGSNIIINQLGYSLIDPSDYLDISINSYNSSIVNGTFSGKMTKIITVSPLVTQQFDLTNGKIINVRMNY